MDTGTGMPTPNASTATKIHLCLLNNWHIWHVHSLLFHWWAFWSIECCRIIVYIVYTYNFPTHSSLYSSFAGKFLWHFSQLGVMTSPAFSPIKTTTRHGISVAAHVDTWYLRGQQSPCRHRSQCHRTNSAIQKLSDGNAILGRKKRQFFVPLMKKFNLWLYGISFKNLLQNLGHFCLMDKLPFKAAGAVDLECT